MSSEPTSSAAAAAEADAADSDNLRRSKRKKFTLDVVAAAHGNNQKKSRRDPHADDDSDVEYDDTDMGELSVVTMEDDDMDESMTRRRSRRSTTVFQGYQQDTMVNYVEMTGPYACHKCPSRYVSKSSLANHAKMHVGEKRKFACELCDFSSSTLKSLSHHHNVHKAFGVLSAPTSPQNSTEAVSPGSMEAPPLLDISTESTSAPQLVVATEEPFAMDLTGEGTPPPLLDREDDGPPVLQREDSVEMEVYVEQPEQPSPVPTRKSGRPAKPTQKKLEQKKRPLRLESPMGSLPNSSTSSSMTPPETRSPDLKTKAKSTKTTSKKIKKHRRHCSKCPFTASTLARLNRHTSGHKLKEGYICPVESCQFISKKAGFLPKHFILHTGTLPWPPKYVKKVGKKIVEMPEKNEHLKRENGELKKKRKRGEMIGQAQIRSFQRIQVDDVTYRKCNIGDCDFKTVSLSQLVIHKAKVHEAKSSFPLHPYLCFTCGHRAKTYGAMRAHKLTTHLKTHRRFSRTFYLKEIVGDKFFIHHFTNEKNMIEEEVVEKVEEKEKEEEEIVKKEEVDEDEEASGDESLDSSRSSETLVTLLDGSNIKPPILCCNVCPYRAPTTSRIERHYKKHFTNDTYKCSYCTWSSRSRDVLVTHEKLHAPVEEESVSRMIPIPKEKEKKEELEDVASIRRQIQKWCVTEKARRPDLDDQFTRKMMDGVKGFQCSDCPYTSKYRGDMRSHKKRHDIEQMHRCVQCTYTTNRPVSLKDHLKQHGAVNQEMSDVKSRKIIANQGIEIGVRFGIGKDRVYKCGKCPYTTVAIGCLWRHSRYHRQQARIHICSNCSYSSIDQRKMEEHTIIHLALGVNEQMPFVKRVDHQGRPVSSLTDLNSVAERKTNKRKLESPEKTPKTAKTSKISIQKTMEPKKILEPRLEPPSKRRRMSKEASPDSDYSGPVSSSQPTRQLSERATRNRINYNLLSKNGSGKPTPSTSSANLDRLADEESDRPEETTELAHIKIREFLKNSWGTSDTGMKKCPECPFKTTDPSMLRRHVHFHIPTQPPRPHVCTDCSFNTYTPTSILQHVQLHAEGIVFDPLMKRMQKNHRKGDIIPPGVKGYYCKNCSFKTANHRNYQEHMAYHRHQLMNRMNISLKRQPPKQEYQRPKHKTLFVARNAKYCKKCTFRCCSQSNFIEHLDRHGWNQLYKCYICDYSDNNKSVVDFHQLTHHMVRDQTLHGISQASEYRLEAGKILKPEFQTEKDTPTPEQFVQKSLSLLKCASCDFYCHVSSELGFHMSVEHPDVPNAKETISYLQLGLVPPNADVNTVL